VHEIFLRHFGAGVTTPSGSSDSLKIAIITAVSVVLAAIITGITTVVTRHRREDHHGEQDYVDELLRRAETAEHHVTRLEDQRDSLNDRVDELERYCWRAGIDPHTGDAVVPIRTTGEGES
jgi:low affinity Fe/Cu permease